MANLKIKDGDGSDKYVQKTGAGSDVDPFVDPAATSLAVLDAWDSSDACKVVGQKVTVTVEFTRPSNTTAYTAGDVVSNSTSATTPLDFANLARVASGTGYITGCYI